LVLNDASQPFARALRFAPNIDAARWVKSVMRQWVDGGYAELIGMGGRLAAKHPAVTLTVELAISTSKIKRCWSCGSSTMLAMHGPAAVMPGRTPIRTGRTLLGK